MIWKKTSSPTAAFTLVELLIGATLSAAIMAAVLSSYIFLGRNLGRLINAQTLESESRRTLAYFTQDVRSASAISGTPSASRLDLTIPTAKGASTITYYYNANAYTSAAQTDDVNINGNTVKMWRQGLTRCVYDGTAMTSQALLKNITDNNSATAPDLYFRYFDAVNNPYDNGSTPFAMVATSSPKGIKQISLQFSTQLGTATNGTLTQVNQVASGRLLLRNRPALQ